MKHNLMKIWQPTHWMMESKGKSIIAATTVGITPALYAVRIPSRSFAKHMFRSSFTAALWTKTFP